LPPRLVVFKKYFLWLKNSAAVFMSKAAA